MKPASSDG